MTEFSLPLPIYTSIKIGELKSREGEIFDIYAGLDKERVEELRKLSLDTTDAELQNNTSDYKRFGQGSYEEWYAKSRTVFSLIHRDTKALAGLMTFGPKPIGTESIKHLSSQELAKEQAADPGIWHTIAFRSYPEFRGKGLMKPFSQRALEIYLQKFPGIKLWAGIHGDNEASKGLSTALGFVPSEQYSNPAKQFWVFVRE